MLHFDLKSIFTAVGSVSVTIGEFSFATISSANFASVTFLSTIFTVVTLFGHN
jgi:hypothetical protein